MPVERTKPALRADVSPATRAPARPSSNARPSAVFDDALVRSTWSAPCRPSASSWSASRKQSMCSGRSTSSRPSPSSRGPHPAVGVVRARELRAMRRRVDDAGRPDLGCQQHVRGHRDIAEQPLPRLEDVAAHHLGEPPGGDPAPALLARREEAPVADRVAGQRVRDHVRRQPEPLDAQQRLPFAGLGQRRLGDARLGELVLAHLEGQQSIGRHRSIIAVTDSSRHPHPRWLDPPQRAFQEDPSARSPGSLARSFLLQHRTSRPRATRLQPAPSSTARACAHSAA